MRVVVPIGGNIVTLQFEGFSEEVNVDDLTKIDYSNLYGELVTVPALLNKVGLLKAEAESILSQKKLDSDIYEANLSRRYRREANITGGKFSVPDPEKPGMAGESLIKLTEDSLSMAITLDIVCQNKRKAVIEAQKNVAFLDSLYWSIQSKDKKLNIIIKPVTPEEFYKEIFECTINTITITKLKDNWTKPQ